MVNFRRVSQPPTHHRFVRVLHKLHQPDSHDLCALTVTVLVVLHGVAPPPTHAVSHRVVGVVRLRGRGHGQVAGVRAVHFMGHHVMGLEQRLGEREGERRGTIKVTNLCLQKKEDFVYQAKTKCVFFLKVFR